MTYFFRQTQMAKGWGKEINAAWDEADHPRGKTTEGSNSGSFAPKGGGGEGGGNKTLEQYAAERVARARRLGEPVPGEDYPMPKDPRWSTPEEAAAYRAAAEKNKNAAAVPVQGPVNPDPRPQVADETERSHTYKNPHGDKLGVGSIVYESWGYDQTNINFYEVTGMSKSGKTVTLREVAAKGARDAHGDRGPMDDYKRAIPGKYIGAPFTRRVSPDGKYTSGKYKHSAGLWGGEDLYYSWYH